MFFRGRERGRKRGTGVGDPYWIDGNRPELVAAFEPEYYRKDYNATSFSNLITHSRSGNATMVDSDGLLKWAPHNLLTYSEAFDEADWTKIDAAVSVTSNAAEAPDGTTTADQITIAAGERGIRQDVSLKNNGDFVLFVKAAPSGSATHIRIATNNTAAWNTGLSEKIALTSEWQIVSVSGDLNSGGASVRVNIGSLDATGAADSDCHGNALIWGAHLYRSDLGGMVDNPDRGDSYVPTTSSAVYLPRRGHHVYNGSAWVNEGLLHESEARTNLLTYSEDFSNAAWTKSSVTVTSGFPAPDGTNTAVKLVESATNSPHQIFQQISASSADHSVSFYVKAGERVYCAVKLYINGGAARYTVVFDLDNLSVTDTKQTGTPTNVNSAILDAGNGWRKCVVTANTQGTTYAQVQISDSATPTFNVSADVTYLGDGTSGIYIWGAQLEAAPTPSSYIPTAGATVTRAAETLTIPSANLPWPTPQVIGPELVTNGTFDTDTSGWSAGGGSSLSIVSGQLRVTASAGGYAYQNITTTLGQAYTISGTSSGAYLVQLSVYNGAGAGSTLIKSTGNVSTGDHEFTFIASSTQTAIRMVTATGTAVNIDWDNISVREINPLSVSIQMDGRMTYADTDNANEVQHYAWGGPTTGDRIIARTATNSTKTGDPFFDQNEGSNFDFVTGADDYYTPGILVPFNIASRHGSTFLNGAVDGVALTANTTPTALPDLSSTDLQLGFDMMGTIKTFRIWDKDLGDTGIEEATAPSLEPSLSLTFDSSESSFVVDDWSA